MQTVKYSAVVLPDGIGGIPRLQDLHNGLDVAA